MELVNFSFLHVMSCPSLIRGLATKSFHLFQISAALSISADHLSTWFVAFLWVWHPQLCHGEQGCAIGWFCLSM